MRPSRPRPWSPRWRPRRVRGRPWSPSTTCRRWTPRASGACARSPGSCRGIGSDCSPPPRRRDLRRRVHRVPAHAAGRGCRGRAAGHPVATAGPGGSRPGGARGGGQPARAVGAAAPHRPGPRTASCRSSASRWPTFRRPHAACSCSPLSPTGATSTCCSARTSPLRRNWVGRSGPDWSGSPAGGSSSLIRRYGRRSPLLPRSRSGARRTRCWPHVPIGVTAGSGLAGGDRRHGRGDRPRAGGTRPAPPRSTATRQERSLRCAAAPASPHRERPARVARPAPRTSTRQSGATSTAVRRCPGPVRAGRSGPLQLAGMFWPTATATSTPLTVLSSAHWRRSDRRSSRRPSSRPSTRC